MADRCALRDDGGRWCWGKGYKGEPFKPSLEDGGWHRIDSLPYNGGGCGLKVDGSLWCWGRAGFTLKPTSSAAFPVLPGMRWKSVAVGLTFGGHQGCAVREDGQLYCWSCDQFAGTTAPEPVGTDSDWSSVGIGDQNACAIKTDGTLWCWGDVNTFGQLADGTTTPHPAPVQVGADADWATVRMHEYGGCATKTNHDLYCWGWNYVGQVGVPITPATAVIKSPVFVMGDVAGEDFDVRGGWTTITTSGHPTAHACAMTSSGELRCWGDSAEGALGHHVGATKGPTQMGTMADVTALGSGRMARRQDGSLWMWGPVASQPHYPGAPGIYVDVRSQVPFPMEPSVAPAGLAGGYGRCLVRGDGTVACHQVFPEVFCTGPAASVCPLVFTQVNADTDWTSVTTSDDAACALKTNGSLWCWGSNYSGELGQGGTDPDNHPVPVQVAAPATWIDQTISYNAGCAVRSDHTLWCWGTLQSPIKGSPPTQIGTDADWSNVVVAGSYYCARKQSGALWCWDTIGQGTATPATLDGQTFTSLSGGGYGVCALRTDGTIWCWDWSLPKQVGTESDWVEVSVGLSGACGRKANGTVWCWGETDGSTGTPASFVDYPIVVTLP